MSQWMYYAQALAVPLEWVFSLSKKTCSDHHNKLSPTMLEALQIFKFTYKQEQLNFTMDLVAEEKDYMISGPITPKAVDELMAGGNLNELAQLFANEDDSD
ncbi:hypothetical protein PAXINDRAFT_7043 [Paxillus involutus ATCC 200175]|nr:hypothetical protein PAXINDRAFT_7043 [Paxillus involutus ATCC 200175]